MSFIAGSVAGDIILGIEGFTQPLLKAEELAAVFPETVEQSLAQPLRELSELAQSMGAGLIGPFKSIDASASESGAAVQDAGEKMKDGMDRGAGAIRDAGHSSEEMGHSILRSMIEAQAAMEFFPDWVVDFWANPLLGVANLAKETGDALVEAFNHVADDAEDMNLAAEKLGVSVEFFSKWSGVAKAVKVDADSLRNGMYMLNRIVGEELQNPTKELTQAFNDLGISAVWLNAHVGDSEAIFTRVQSAIGLMTNAQERSFVVQELMNRGAQELIPLFMMQKSQIDDLMQSQEKFGDVVTATEAKTSQAWQKIKTEFWQMVDGIEMKAVEFSLDFLTAHQDEIEAEFQKMSKMARDEIGKIEKEAGQIDWNKVWREFRTDLNDIIDDIPKLGHEIADAVKIAVPYVEELAHWAEEAWKWLDKVIGFSTPPQHQTYDKFGNATKGTDSGTKGESGMDAIADYTITNDTAGRENHVDPLTGCVTPSAGQL